MCLEGQVARKKEPDKKLWYKKITRVGKNTGRKKRGGFAQVRKLKQGGKGRTGNIAEVSDED